jgi:uncharacterized membrane protein YccC
VEVRLLPAPWRCSENDPCFGLCLVAAVSPAVGDPVKHLNKLAAVAGFVVLGLSPSFLDWQESPEKRPQMIAYYGIAIVLIWVGLGDWITD